MPGGSASLANQWEQVKRIRKRFRKSSSFLEFPLLASKADEEGAETKENPITTQSLALNATAVNLMVQQFRVLSGKKVPVKQVEAAVTCP